MGLLDQAFSSITNFALSALVARSVSPREFGAFALIFATYLLALGVIRSFATLPLLIRFSSSEHEDWRIASKQATGSALVGGLMVAVPCAAAALVFRSEAESLLILALALPGLMLQETLRMAFVSRGSPGMAVVNDAIWAAFLAVGMYFALHRGVSSAHAFVLLWGASGSLAAVLGLGQAGLIPSIPSVWLWTSQHLDISARQLAEFLTLTGSNQLVVYGAGWISSLEGAGALRAAQVLFGPLRTAYQGVSFVALSEFARIRQRRPESLLRLSVLVSAALGLTGLLSTAAFVTLGSMIGPILLGDTWANTRGLVAPVGIAISTIGFSLGFSVALRALEELGRSLRVRLVVGSLTILFGIIGLATAGAAGGAWGMAGAGVIGTAMWAHQLVKAAGAIRESDGSWPGGSGASAAIPEETPA